MSPYLEQKVVYLGAMLPYETASESLKMLLDVEVSDSTIYRLTDCLGSKAEERLKDEQTSKHSLEDALGESDRCYGQLDGTMVQIREEGWKEVKLARIFKADDIIDSGKRQRIQQSIYTGVLGNKEEFEKLFLKILPSKLDEKTELVFVTDGAVWIRQMLESTYPKAVNILDFFHLMEHTAKFIEINYKKENRHLKLKQWKEVLLVKGSNELKQLVQSTRTRTKQALKEKMNLLNYLENNKDRIDYPEYLLENYYIGSGAIESAHRHVIQNRMKKAGQIWSRRGAEKMLSLRISLKNGEFENLFENSDQWARNAA